MLPFKKAPAAQWGRRNNSVATLLAVVTETSIIALLNPVVVLVVDRQTKLKAHAWLLSRDLLSLCIRLPADQCQGHEDHDRQANDFVRILCE